jgi:peptide/nickel transport system permease protein
VSLVPRGKYTGYLVRRLLAFIPLLIGVSVVTFFLVRMLPGDPARTLAGSTPYEGVVESIRHRMGLDQPIYIQYFLYVRNIFRGDLGDSWFTGNPVAVDIAMRAPATLELITYGLIAAVVLGLFLGITGAFRPNGLLDRIAQFYGFLAGAIPDFWLALLVIFFLFRQLHLIPAPIGRLPLTITPPPTVTGFLTIDALIAGDFVALKAAFSHLIGPVLSLGLIFAGFITKQTCAHMRDTLAGDMVHYARACGLPERVVIRYAFHSILPPVVTVIGFLYALMIGGVVLIEAVFSWNGLGQYAVQSIVNKNYSSIQAFVLIAAVFSLVVYLIVDIIYMLIDPRVRL